MRSPRFLTLAVSAVALTACNPFHHANAVEVSSVDPSLNTRWHANLATPANLAGVVQMNGSASMAPGANNSKTNVVLNLANAAPGGVHPWAVHLGQCGADDGVFGPPEAYKPVSVGNDGRGSATATIPIQTPTEGSYFVSVRASAANADMIVACGNLAPPTQ